MQFRTESIKSKLISESLLDCILSFHCRSTLTNLRLRLSFISLNCEQAEPKAGLLAKALTPSLEVSICLRSMPSIRSIASSSVEELQAGNISKRKYK